MSSDREKFMEKYTDFIRTRICLNIIGWTLYIVTLSLNIIYYDDSCQYINNLPIIYLWFFAFSGFYITVNIVATSIIIADHRQNQKGGLIFDVFGILEMQIRVCEIIIISLGIIILAESKCIGKPFGNYMLSYFIWHNIMIALSLVSKFRKICKKL